MKLEETNIARKLRGQGFSINEIVIKTGFVKSSVSLWVRDIDLTKEQKTRLSKKGHTLESIEKRRTTRLNNENARRQVIIDNAKKEILSISKKELQNIGTMLYWAEGGKTQRGLVRFSNGDPLMIQVMMRFFKEVCRVPDAKFRGYIHIHPHLNIEKAEKYWTKISGISQGQFFKTYNKKNVSSKNKRDSLPFGTFDIYVCDTILFLTIKGWTEKVSELVLK